MFLLCKIFQCEGVFLSKQFISQVEQVFCLIWKAKLTRLLWVLKQGLWRVVSQPQSDFYMFLLCDMFWHKLWRFIQNHLFHTWSRFCARYVRQNRQVCCGEAGRGLSVSHNPRDDNQQSHKTRRSGIFYIVPSLSFEAKRIKKEISSLASEVFLRSSLVE